MRTTDELTIGELARRSGMAPSALRYYEELGLITSSRTSSGRRRFERGTLRRLAFVRAGRNVGLTLEEIPAALRDPARRADPDPSGLDAPVRGLAVPARRAD